MFGITFFIRGELGKETHSRYIFKDLEGAKSYLSKYGFVESVDNPFSWYKMYEEDDSRLDAFIDKKEIWEE